jgi:hypothetical protein
VARQLTALALLLVLAGCSDDVSTACAINAPMSQEEQDALGITQEPLQGLDGETYERDLPEECD